MEKIKHSNIPIFLPELSCPHQCVFCNQQEISGHSNIPSPADAAAIIEQYLSTMNDGRKINIAFFGGSFTGIEMELQEAYLKMAYSFIKDDRVNGIRLSTRPDYINEEILDLLKTYKVTTIELGAQSTNNTVLTKSGRGHKFEHIQNAAGLIREYEFELGLQMMIGLPHDTFERSIQTANDIVSLGASNTRIYPTLVVKDTALEKLYNRGIYKPLPLDEAVKWTKEIVKIFVKNNVKILRIGLHPSEELTEGNSLIAGPSHPSFNELVLTEMFHENILNSIAGSGRHTISANSKFINYAVGYKQKTKSALHKNGINFQFKVDNLVKDYEVNVSYN